MTKQQGFSRRIFPKGSRYKGNPCYVTIAEAHMISTSSQREEATNGCVDTSPPIPLMNRKILVGQSRKYSTRSKHANGLNGASVSHDSSGRRKRKIQSKPTRGGNKSGALYIQKIDEAEFERARSNSFSKMGVPTRLENDKGSGNKDVNSEEFEIKKISMAEFFKSRDNCGVTLDPPIHTDFSKGYCADTCEKNGANVTDMIPSANFGNSVGLKGDNHGSHEGWWIKSTPIVHISDSDNDDVNLESGIKKIDKAEFTNSEKHSVSMTRPSSSKNVYDAKRALLNTDLYTSPCTGQLVDESSPLGQKGIDGEHLTSKQISTSQQGLFEGTLPAKSGKNADTGKEVFCKGCRKLFSLEDAMRDSAEKRTNELCSFEEEENSNEDMDLEIMVERIDESMFGKGRKGFTASSQGDDGTLKMRYPTQSVEGMIGSSSDSDKSDDASMHSSDYETSLGVASRTRSKMQKIKQPSELAVDAFTLSKYSDSPSTDNGFETSDHEFACFSHVASIKQTEGGKTSKADEAHREYEERRRILNYASNEEGFKQSDNERGQGFYEEGGSGSKPSAKRRSFSHIASNIQTKRRKKSNENAELRDDIQKIAPWENVDPERNLDEVDGTNRMLQTDQLLACTRKQKKSVSPSSKDEHNQIAGNKNNEDNGGGDEINREEVVSVTNRIEKITKGARGFAKHYDFCKILVDSVLGNRQKLEPAKCDAEDMQEHAAHIQNSHAAHIQNSHAAHIQNFHPLRFGFEDEVPKEVEKSEYEKEMESLFTELEVNWTLSVLGNSTDPEADQEIVNSPLEETQYEWCARGQHELVLEDDEGLFCKYCHHVEHEPRDIMPQLVENIHRGSRRKLPDVEKHINFDALQFQLSTGDWTDLSQCSSGTVWNIKPGIQESMYEHQQEGFEFLWKNLAGSINIEDLKNPNPSGVGGCIISHAPGTGKTRLTIVFIETYLKMFPHCRPMIIAPAGMLLTWEEEFKKWDVEFPFHNLNNLELLGKESNAALGLFDGCKCQDKDAVRLVKLYSWNVGRSVLGISYSLFEKLTGQKCNTERRTKVNKKSIVGDDKMEAVRKILIEKPGLVVLDEGHTPRNKKSNIWNVLVKLETEKRVILSGTPFQNNFAELFNTLRLVRPAVADALSQEKTFAEMINARRISSRKRNGENSHSAVITEVMDRAVEKLKIYMSPFVHVHKGTILKKNLPGLRDCVVLLKPPTLQKSLLERLVGMPNTFKFEHDAALISVHPCLAQYCESTEEQKHGIDMEAVEASRLNPNEGVKTKFIVEFVRLSVVMNEKVLVFGQYIHPLQLIKDQLKEVFGWVEGKQILQMQGTVDQKHRQGLINIFNDPQNESKIMLASTKCCSEGISLVGASRVILLDVVWNPSVERQAISRAYRIGQKKFVHTYHLMTSGTTEADKYCRQAEKERLSELVFSSSSNEITVDNQSSLGIEDRILEEMVARPRLKGMFEKIINQPKDTNLMQTFGLTD